METKNYEKKHIETASNSAVNDSDSRLTKSDAVSSFVKAVRAKGLIFDEIYIARVEEELSETTSLCYNAENDRKESFWVTAWIVAEQGEGNESKKIPFFTCKLRGANKNAKDLSAEVEAAIFEEARKTSGRAFYEAQNPKVLGHARFMKLIKAGGNRALELRYKAISND